MIKQQAQQEQDFEQRMKRQSKPSDLRYAFGIVISPKTGEPFLCCSKLGESADFQMRRFDGSREGEGSFEEFEDSACFVPAARSNHPRVHIPSGVVNKGQGNGTALYVCSAVAAFVAPEIQEFRIEYGPSDADLDNTAVCSARYVIVDGEVCDRSHFSSGWWDRAAKLGLSTKEKFAEHTQRDIDDCLDADQSRKLLNMFVDDVSSDDDIGDADVSVCASGTYEYVDELIVDVLSMDAAKAANLVVAYTTSPLLFPWMDGLPSVVAPRSASRGRRDRNEWDYFNVEAARAVNVGVFRQFGNGETIFEAWSELCAANGMLGEEIEQMAARFRAGVDIAPKATQEQPRANPSRRDAVRTVPVKRYSKARRNPAAPEQKLAAALLEERVRLGWTRLAGLP